MLNPRLVLAALVVCMGTACSTAPKRITEWSLEYRPMTQAEQDATTQEVTIILSAAGHLKLEGHDQDLDDYAQQVYLHAPETTCPPRLFERWREEEGLYWHYTGRWEPLNGNAPEVPHD